MKKHKQAEHFRFRDH